MSIKGKDINVNNIEVPNEDLCLRINMVNLSLKDDFQIGDYVSRHYPDPVRGKTNELNDMRIPKQTIWMMLIVGNEIES